MKKYGGYIIFITMVIVASFLTVLYIRYTRSVINETTIVNNKLKYVSLHEIDTLTIKDINLKIRKYRIKFPNIVLSQVILESDWLKSPIARKNSNLFGMNPSLIRQTTSSCQQYGYAYYESIDLCIIDYALWQANNTRNCKNEEQYYNCLSKVYAEDPKYVIKLKILSLKLNKILN